METKENFKKNKKHKKEKKKSKKVKVIKDKESSTYKGIGLTMWGVLFGYVYNIISEYIPAPYRAISNAFLVGVVLAIAFIMSVLAYKKCRKK